MNKSDSAAHTHLSTFLPTLRDSFISKVFNNPHGCWLLQHGLYPPVDTSSFPLSRMDQESCEHAWSNKLASHQELFSLFKHMDVSWYISLFVSRLRTYCSLPPPVPQTLALCDCVVVGQRIGREKREHGTCFGGKQALP